MPSPDGRMGQLSSPSPPPGPSVTDSIPSPTKVVALQTSKTIDSPQHIPHPRPRKYSVVDEEDEAGASGSESSRRSQRYWALFPPEKSSFHKSSFLFVDHRVILWPVKERLAHRWPVNGRPIIRWPEV